MAHLVRLNKRLRSLEHNDDRDAPAPAPEPPTQTNAAAVRAAHRVLAEAVQKINDILEPPEQPEPARA